MMDFDVHILFTGRRPKARGGWIVCTKSIRRVLTRDNLIMCLTLFTHHCSAGHETRPLCTLNPATDCTVVNPNAEPWRNPCATPCIGNGDASVNPEHRCPWHGDYCRLARVSMCGAFDPGQCPNNIPYHQRREPPPPGLVSEEVDLTQEQFPPIPLFNEPPWFAALRWDLFQAATDLYNVGTRRTSYAAAVEQARDSLLPPSATTKRKARGTWR